MKSSKKPSNEPSLSSRDESRRTNVLIEQMLSKFNAFGEVQSAMRDRLEPKFDKIEQKVDVLEAAVRSHTDAIRANTEATHSMQADLKNINQRVEVVEAKLAS